MGAAPLYTTREAVKSDLDIAETARANALVDRCIESASRGVEALLRRRFYPQYATRSFDWPNLSQSGSDRLWLDEHFLISLTSLTSGGETVTPADTILYPNDGPPYDRIELNRADDGAWTTDATSQNSIVITGLWGENDDQADAGALNGAVNSSVTLITIDPTDAIGIGSLIKIDSERMIVTGKNMADTTEDLTAGLDADVTDQEIAGIDPTLFVTGDVILVGAEKMRVDEIAGTSLIVTRAVDGSTLGAHALGASVYAYRSLVVRRGAVGSTAASHLDNAAITVWEVPGLIEELTAAEALNAVLQKGSGYARTTGSGDNEREASGRALRDVRARAIAAYGRLLNG